MVTKKHYGKFNGSNVNVYTLSSGDLSVDVCDLGARVNAIRFRGKDVALGFNSTGGCIENDCYIGSTKGRVANRIRGGRFVIDGRPYFVVCNEGSNQLHGGLVGFDKHAFAALPTSDGVVMTLVSPDGDQGYPGTLTMHATFKVRDNALTVWYSAVSDRDTLWAPTCGVFFNLDGENAENCLANELTISSDSYTPADEQFIPTGVVAPVAGTPYDFTSPKLIGRDISSPELAQTEGFDCNYVLNNTSPAAIARSAATGICMQLSTDLPCLQFYSGNRLHAAHGKSGAYKKWSGFALEPQFAPNAVNMPGFDSPIIRGGQSANHYIKYAFSAVE